jgi:toxin ParE1/3/4
MSGYSVSPQALDDLFEIWQYIAPDSEEAADQVQSEFYDLFCSLAQTPGKGHSRKDLTRRDVLFLPLYSYLIVNQPDAATGIVN